MAEEKPELSPAEKAAALRKAEAEATLKEAEARKANTDADAAAIKALLPGAATLKPLEGSVTTDEKSGIVAETAAYALLEDAASTVAAAVKDKLQGARVLVVTDRQLAASDWPYTAVKVQVARLTTELCDVLETLAPPAAPAESEEESEPPTRAAIAPAAAATVASALPSIVGAVADVAGFFQSDYTFTGRAFELKLDPAVAAMAGALANAGVKVVVDGFSVIRETETMAAFDRLLQARWQVTAARLALEQTRLATAVAEVERRRTDFARRQTALTAAETAKPPDENLRAAAETALEAARHELQKAEAAKAVPQGLVDVAKAAETRADALVAAITTAPASGGLPPLGQAALREALHRGDGVFTHVLHVAVSGSGGETQIRKRRFFAPTVRYVGACTVSVMVAAVDGTIVYSGSQALVGQLTFEVKAGEIGVLRKVELSSAPPGWAVGGSD